MTIISGPVPPYQNLPIQPENYTPKRFDIQDIILDRSTLVETVVPHDYVIGQLCRLIIPESYGCYQLNNKEGYVISIPSDTEVVLNIDSSNNVDPFTMGTMLQAAQILAIGDINMGAQNLTNRNMTTYIPGSFRNIS